MRRFGGLWALAALIVNAVPVVAQGFPHPWGGYPSGFSYRYSAPGLRFSIGFGFSPPSFGFPTTYPDGWFVPGWGGGVWWPQPVVIIVPPPVFSFPTPGWDRTETRESPQTTENSDRVARRIDDAVRRGDLLVVDPKGNGTLPTAALRPAPKRGRVPPPLALPKKDEPPPGPAEQAMALVRSAQEAFEAGELGRATERLIAAIGVQPDTPLPYFLLAQVRTARGEYIEAVEAIRTGMNRAPDWPTTKFQLTDFYGSKPARLAADWAELTKALEANPDHPTLQFLEAYHLWFLGERDRATALFQKLALKIRDSEVVERFLRATHR